MDKFRSKTLQILVSLMLIFSTVTFTQQAVAAPIDETGPAMAGDLLFARPIGLLATVLGSAAFVVSLPFTLLGGNVGEAAEVLVVKPAKFTFVRPLGGD